MNSQFVRDADCSVPASLLGKFRWHLLTTVSAVAIVTASGAAQAQDMLDGKWSLEVGGGYDQYSGQDTDWFSNGLFGFPGSTAKFAHSNAAVLPSSSSLFHIGAKDGWNVDGKATFEPSGSDWVFSLGVQYGRTNTEHSSHSGYFRTDIFSSGFKYNSYSATASHREDHAVVDFEAGKDFGLGMFGREGSSVFSAGVRFAHFGTKTHVSFSTESKYGSGAGSGTLNRRFNGVGPIISWDASTPFSDLAPLSLDWGADAAILFGSQKASGEGNYDGYFYGTSRSRNRTVPTVGAYVAASYHFADSGAKFSLGYKFDTYFNVLDGGLVAHKEIDRTFAGPYLNVGIQTN